MMITHHFRKITILVAILAIFLAACGPTETEVPEPTDVPVVDEATAESAPDEAEATEEAMDDEDMEATEEPMDDEAMGDDEEMAEATEEPMDDEAMGDDEEMAEATEEPMDDEDMGDDEEMEATEEPMDDEAMGDDEEMAEATEEPMDGEDMGDDEEMAEATEEPMGDEDMGDDEEMAEATEEPMDDEDMGDDEEMAEATEEPMDDEAMGNDEEMDDMDDMSDVAVVTFEGFADDEDTFTFDYPEGYELTESDNAVNLAMGDQTLVVIAPPRFNTVFGTTIDAPAEGTEENLAFFVERLGYTAGETSDMMMAAESINIELPRRGLVGFANLIDLGDGLFGVVLELGPDADNVPSSDGAIIGESMSFTPAPPPPPEEDMEDAEAESADDEGEEESDESEDSEESDDEAEASDEDMAEEPTLTIVGLALNTDGLSTLGTAVARAGFVSTLNGEGPFTVFAPTDEAFEVALEALGLTAAELLAEENRDLLTSVLTYHVVSGAVLSTDLEDGMEVETLNGAILTVGVSDDGVTLTDGTGAVYNVTAADVMASNGVVHVIDGVLLPPADE